MGLPIGCDVCYTNHAEADQDDMDTLLTLLCAAGLTFLIGVPGADDIMLNYQSTSFHDALYARRLLGLKHVPGVRRLAGEDADYRSARRAAAHRRPPSAAVRPAARSLRMNRPDAWNPLREFTDARIALGRSGASLPTREVLNFGLAHARARDAIHQPFASQQLVAPLAALGLDALTVHSAAPDRHTYLRRPDLGRRLADESRRPRRQRRPPRRPAAGDRRRPLFLGGRAPGGAVDPRPAALSADAGIGLAPVVLAHQSRVALGDDIGETLKARAVAILIGERPGLSSPDSLGVYLTWQPHRQRLESERNCISNIRPED